MKLEVARRLRELQESRGREHGKLVQKLLAIAFLEAGVTRLTDRCIQGIDLELELNGRQYALEVKTSETSQVRLGKKDLEGLAVRAGHGIHAYVAVLGNRLIDGWVFARFFEGELLPRAYSTLELRPYRDRALERTVAETFPQAVLAHAATAARGQTALDDILTRYPAYERA